ncbi:unnamed protein product [Cunninghamella echinulata]
MSLKRTLSIENYCIDYYTNYHLMGSKQSSLNSTPKRTKRSTTNSNTTYSLTNDNHNNNNNNNNSSNNNNSNNNNNNNNNYQSNIFNEQLCLQWFQQYSDPDTPKIISPEGTQQFLQDLGISVEEKLAIVIAWKLNAATMGYITQEEWLSGMQELGVDNMNQLLKYRQDMELALQDPTTFKSIYRYTFNYGKNKDQKCMDVDVACALWSVLFENQFPILQQFIQFLQEKMPVRVINRDQWQNLYEFITTVSVDLSDYDEAAAWPVLFDEYVDWKRSLM